MSDFNRIDGRDLDRYITGNYGEDQLRNENDDEPDAWDELLEAAQQAMRVWPDHLRGSTLEEAIKKLTGKA